ncbi:MAG: glycosyltransferase family 2 protein, partial [Phycisphaerae bacterium]|nr:glycosyltransferase family 2 protein [Phycisphaerae bacterium]
GGKTEGVPKFRLLISRMGNRVLRWMMPGSFRTYTSLFRCYRRQVLDDLVLESNGKELHLEIMAKAIALGYRGIEVPATLRGRKKGKSKFRFRRIAQSHIEFGLNEKPMLMFGIVGLSLLLLAVALGIVLLVESARGEHMGGRPITLFTVFLGLAGMIVFAVGFIAVQNVSLRNEIFKVKRQNVRLGQQLGRISDILDDANKPNVPRGT